MLQLLTFFVTTIDKNNTASFIEEDFMLGLYPGKNERTPSFFNEIFSRFHQSNSKKSSDRTSGRFHE